MNKYLLFLLMYILHQIAIAQKIEVLNKEDIFKIDKNFFRSEDSTYLQGKLKLIGIDPSLKKNRSKGYFSTHLYPLDGYALCTFDKNGRLKKQLELYDEENNLLLKANTHKGEFKGKFKEYKKGQIVRDLFYRKKKPTGNVNDIIGDRIFKYYLDKGEKEGDYTITNFKKGVLLHKSTFVNKKIHGLSNSYYDNGQLKEAINFVNGYKNGNFRRYDSEGNLKEEATFGTKDTLNRTLSFHVGKHNFYRKKKLSISKEYNEKGELIYMRKFYENGKIKESFSLKDGEVHGLLTKYSEKGIPLIEYSYENGEIINEVSSIDSYYSNLSTYSQTKLSNKYGSQIRNSILLVSEVEKEKIYEKEVFTVNNMICKKDNYAINDMVLSYDTLANFLGDLPPYGNFLLDKNLEFSSLPNFFMSKINDGKRKINGEFYDCKSIEPTFARYKKATNIYFAQKAKVNIEHRGNVEQITLKNNIKIEIHPVINGCKNIQGQRLVGDFELFREISVPRTNSANGSVVFSLLFKSLRNSKIDYKPKPIKLAGQLPSVSYTIDGNQSKIAKVPETQIIVFNPFKEKFLLYKFKTIEVHTENELLNSFIQMAEIEELDCN